VTASTSVITDDRNHHAVVVTIGGESRIFFRADVASVASVAHDNLRRDIARHGESVIGFDELPRAVYRTTKVGRLMLMAE